MGFLANMNFPRAVILVSFITACVLGYYVQEETKRLDEVHRELAGDVGVDGVQKVVQDIQRLGIEVEQYQQLANASTTRGEEFDFTGYIRSIAADEVVRVGQMDIDPSRRTPLKDIEDRIYKIQPSNKNQRYSRSTIGNFLYKLEAESRRIKVTNFELRPHKTVRPGDLGTDEWTFDASITARRRVSGSS